MNPSDSIEEQALAAFRAGLNCAQAVFTAFADKLGYDRDMAIGASAGFGGGMGRLQETCGVVTGAFMVIGVFNNSQYPDNLSVKENSYAMVREFSSRFIEKHESLTCKALIKCDLSTPEGREVAKVNRLHETICVDCMCTSIRLLSEMIP